MLRRRSSAGSILSSSAAMSTMPLDHIGRLGPAVAAIGPHRIGVGEHRRDVGVHRGRAVDAGERAEVADEGRGSRLQIGADIGDAA